MKPLFEPTTVVAVRDIVVPSETVQHPAVAVVPTPGYAAPPPLPKGSMVPSPKVAPPPVTEEQISAIGAQAANSLKGISAELLNQVKVSDAAEFGQGLNQLVVLAKGLSPAQLEDAGLLGRLRGMFSSAKERLVGQYATVEKQIDALTLELDAKAVLHKKRISDLEQLYLNNMAYHQKLEEAVYQCHDLLAQVNKAYDTEKQKATENSFDAQVLADYDRVIARLEKRISDLDRAMLLAKQVAPQIRMMQDDARSLVGSFGDVKAVTLPAWKNTFSLYILQQEQQKAAKLLNDVSDMTDQALRQSADLLRQNAGEIAKARNRELVSVDTLKHINAQLIGAVEDVKRIDAEGKQRRLDDKLKLQMMEQELVSTFSPGTR